MDYESAINMANHSQQLLNTWYEQRNDLDWVLATIIATEGSSYRKPGAMMMINSLGQYHGLLSGGCLESDIMRQSRQCWMTGNNRIIQYDMREEEDIAWQLGIGCGGLVRILLQPINPANNFLQLCELRQLINQNKACKYIQSINESAPNNKVCEIENGVSSNNNAARRANKKDTPELNPSDETIFEHIIKPSLKLAIFGGGIDAMPVAQIASNLGWHVSIADPRTGYARKTQFADAKQIIKTDFANASEHIWLSDIDAIVIMTHNVKLDAQALLLAQGSSALYVGMLGPAHRTERVLKEAGFSASECENKHQQTSSGLTKRLANPIGLKLGGELPESIALSILSEIHAFIENADGRSFSNILS
jgi:xanthine/CO dehydrogenase XdhC/CoxF family maturation factor